MKRFLILFIVILATTLGDSTAQLNKNYFYYRGRDYIVEGKYREAIESLNILLRSQSKEYEGFFLRGVAKYNLDDLNGALSDFTRALEENPAYTQAYQYRAITRSRMGLYNEALGDFEKAIEMRPNVPASYYSRGVTYFLNRQFEKSVSDFSQFLRLEPRQPEGYINRGTSKLYMNDTIAALEDYNRAIAVNPYWSDAYLRRGLLSLMRNQYSESIDDLSRTLSLDSTSAIAYFYRGIAKNNINDIRGSLFDFDKSIANDSTSAIAYFNRAIIRSSIGDYNRAIDDYTKVAQSNPNNVLVFYNRAAVYSQIGDYRNAINDYTRAIELYPDFANAYRYRSQLRAAQGDKRGSMSDLNIAQAKIAEYQSKMNDSTFAAFADTSRHFSKMMSFDANLGEKAKDFSDIKANVRSIKLLPLFRLTISQPDTTFAYTARRYDNRRLSRFISDTYIPGLQMLNKSTDYNTQTVEYLDSQNNNPQSWNEIFEKGITQTLMSQYNSAMNYWNYAITERPSEPYPYINRSTTQAEMIEFIASLEGNYQTLNIDNDPATRLKGAAKQQTYDYSKAIADLRKAAELMPELPHIYYNLGNLLFLSGDMSGAIAQYSKAIELFPYFAEAYYNRGLVQIYIKEKTTGCMDMSRAGELGIDNAYTIIRQYCSN